MLGFVPQRQPTLSLLGGKLFSARSGCLCVCRKIIYGETDLEHQYDENDCLKQATITQDDEVTVLDFDAEGNVWCLKAILSRIKFDRIHCK